MVASPLPAFPLDITTGPGIEVSREGAATRIDIVAEALPTSGVGNVFRVDTGSRLKSLRGGVGLLIQADRTNTGPVTLVVDGMERPLLDAGGNPQIANRIVEGRFYQILFDAGTEAWRVQAGASTLDEIPGLNDAVFSAAEAAERALAARESGETAAAAALASAEQTAATQTAVQGLRDLAKTDANTASQAAATIVARGSPTAVQVADYGLDVPIVLETPSGDFVYGGWDELGRLDTYYHPDRIASVVGAFRYEPLAGASDEPPLWGVVDADRTILVGHAVDGRAIFANLVDTDAQEIVLGLRKAAPYIVTGNLFLAGRAAPLVADGTWLSAYPLYGHVLAARQYSTVAETSTWAVERAGANVTPTLWPTARKRIVALCADGQSNIVGSGGIGPTDAGAGVEPRNFVTPPYSDVLMLDTGAASDVRGGINRSNGTSWSQINPASIVGFTPLVSRQFSTGPQGETPMEAAAVYLEKDLVEKLGLPARVLGIVTGLGGASIRTLSKNPPAPGLAGGVPFNDLPLMLARVKALCDAAGDDLWVPYLGWNQGQGDDDFATQAEWEAFGRAYVADRLAGIRASTGQLGAIPVLAAQPEFREPSNGGGYNATLAQLAMHVDPSIDFWLIGPCYQALARGTTQFKGYNKDGLHHNALGHHDEGERRHNYFMSLLAGQRRKCTRPILLTQAGNVVTMKFEMQVKPLVIDTVTISDPGNAGLRLFAADNTEIAITSYALSGDDSIAMTVPNGASVGYGTTLKGWTTPFAVRGSDTFQSYPLSEMPRTCIRDSDPTVSRRDGAPLWNWCLYSKIARTI